MDALINKYIYLDEADFYRVGKVVAAVGPDKVLVRFVKQGESSYSQVIELEEILAALIFDDENEVDSYLRWLQDKQDKSLKLVPRNNRID